MDLSYTIICNLIHNGSSKVHNINIMTARSRWPMKCCCRATDMQVEEGRSCCVMLMTGALCYRIGTE